MYKQTQLLDESNVTKKKIMSEKRCVCNRKLLKKKKKKENRVAQEEREKEGLGGRNRFKI